LKDAIMALESLGYKKIQVQNTLNKHIKADKDLSTEEIIKIYLQVQNK